MTEVQGFLQDLLTIDCDIQTHLSNLALITSRDALEARSGEIKSGLKAFKAKLRDMKEFCDIYSTNENTGFISIFNRTNEADYYSSPTLTTSSPREILSKELQIQSEHLASVESRFRNSYLAAQVKLDQLERDSLFDNSLDLQELSAKKRNINSKLNLF